MQTFKVKIKPQTDRLDLYLVSQYKDLSRTKIQKLITDGFILVDGHKVAPNYKIKKDNQIAVNLPAPKPTQLQPEDLQVKIIYEDDDLIVIDKDSGVVVHPTADHTSGTIVNWLLFHVKSIGNSVSNLRPGIVHRLDKNTSGLLLIGKNESATEKLKKQFAARSVKKKYLALVSPKLAKPFGTIEGKIGRDPHSFQKFAVSGTGKEAVTDYRLVKNYRDCSLVEVFPKTGRTHQIRVHLSSIGHPILGDKLYRGKMSLNRIFLHAAEIEFKHPKTNEPLIFSSSLPPDLQTFLDKLSLK